MQGWASIMDRLNPKHSAFDFTFRERWQVRDMFGQLFV
jgi:hypothetical protein